MKFDLYFQKVCTTYLVREMNYNVETRKDNSAVNILAWKGIHLEISLRKLEIANENLS